MYQVSLLFLKNFILVLIVMDGSLALFFFDLAIFGNLFQGKYLGQILTWAGAALHLTARI